MSWLHIAVATLVVIGTSQAVRAQSVCLPLPRLLSTMPMGGQAGTAFDVTIAGQSLQGQQTLRFSNPGIIATPKLDPEGKPIPNQFVVEIADDCEPGVYDARVMANLGISSARAFSVSELPEVTPNEKCTTLDTAVEISLRSIVNASLVDRSVNHYAFEIEAGRRVFIDCAAKGIDSKMKPVIALADHRGNDLVVERRGGVIDFEIPETGRYIIKVHDLTFKGGPHYFYRLLVSDFPLRDQSSATPSSVLANAAANLPRTPKRLPRTSSVASFSWPPVGLSKATSSNEVEPNDRVEDSQRLHLPCDLTGRFYPAADVDSYEFDAKKGDVWWVEIASERLGRPTDPSVIVQRIDENGETADVIEMSDIPSPVKRSTNGYSYDGPPYNAGSPDVNGRFEAPQDGRYRLRVTDLFGGTRNDPGNIYRLIVRRAKPDFAIVGWALHMGLRNGDRNALSKPIALRGGAVMPIEVVVVRRDGFDGEIVLSMDQLPVGVTATGLKIAAGKSRGIVLVSAAEDAPRGLSFASIQGRAMIDGREVVRDCPLASMKWPVVNAKAEIPDPRLVQEIPVSVGGAEVAGLSIEAANDQVWSVEVGGKLTIPLKLTRRGEFSGKSMVLQTFGAGFEKNPKFDFSLVNERTDAILDLARLKTPPGEYTLAFYGGAVAKYGAGQSKPKDIVDIYVSRPIRVRVVSTEGKSE